MDPYGRPARRRFRARPWGRPFDPAVGDPQMPPARRGRFGFWGPVPFYSRRTRRGEVSVGGCGCCLPIPLLALIGTAAGLRSIWRHLR